MAGYEWKGDMPFQQVYFTGMVRDKQRRKMSKSLGNSPDALELIDKFGADGVRFGLLSSSPAGGDLLFDEKLCEQGRNFCNKMWNGLRLVKSWEVVDVDNQSGELQIRQTALSWFEDQLRINVALIQEDFEKYRLSEAVMRLYNFVWDDFFSWLLEVVKPPYGNPIDASSYQRVLRIYEDLMKLLHPFMPFVTEEIYQQLQPRNPGDFVGLTTWPSGNVEENSLDEPMRMVQSLVTEVRDLRNKHQLKQKEGLEFFLADGDDSRRMIEDKGIRDILIKMAALENISITKEAPKALHASIVQGRIKAFVLLPDVDVEQERKKLMEELEYARGFVKQIESKLANEKFVQNAPPAIVDKERKKLEDGTKRVEMLTESLNRL